MKHHYLLPVIAIVATAAPSTLHAQTPALIPYQGRVQTGTPPADFTGTGQFKFALMQSTTATRLWVNNGALTADPVNAVSLTVTNGLYSVMLGDTSITNMAAIPPAVFANPDVRLRVWFNGTQLSPDQRLAANGYLPSGTQVLAAGGGNPGTNGLQVFNPANTASQDAILSARVAGSAGGNPLLSFDIANEAGWAIGIDNQDANKLKFGASWNSVSSNTMMTLTTSGNLSIPGRIGLGVPSPSSRLDVMGDATATWTAAFWPPGGGHASHIHDGANKDWYIRSGASAGKVVIQDTGGTASIGNMTILPRNRLGTAYNDSATFDIAGTTGYIGIWDNLEVSSNVYVHADIWKEFSGSWYKLGSDVLSYAIWESSDQRLKKEIAPLTGALDTLGQIRGVSYLWNEAGLQHLTRGIEESWASKSGTEADNKKLWAEKRAEAAKELSRRQTGFIAQELEKVFPSWVRTDEKGFKQIDVHSMAAVLVQGVNELSAQNKEQAAALTALEKTNAVLAARVAELEAAAKAGDARLTKLETTTANLAALLEKQTSATTAGVSTASAGR